MVTRCNGFALLLSSSFCTAYFGLEEKRIMALKQQTKSRIVLLVIIGIFIFPIVGSKFLFNHAVEHGVDSTNNVGEFILPPVKISGLDEVIKVVADRHLDSENKWIVIVNDCTDDCVKVARLVRNFRMSLNKDYFNVEPVFVEANQGEISSTEKAGMSEDLFFTSSAQLIGFNTAFANKGTYLIDPDGFAMMYYPGEFDPKGVKKDLKRLIKRRPKAG